LSETLARLIGLLDADRVGTPVLEETHRPDAFHLESFSWQLSEKISVPERLPVCALRRFRPPISASVLLDENKPIHLRSSETCGKIRKTAGLYLFCGIWWDKKFWEHADWDWEREMGFFCLCHGGDKRGEVDGFYDKVNRGGGALSGGWHNRRCTWISRKSET